MKISVIMPTYNGQEFIEETLSSIVHQSKPPDEIIISDDNSTDRTCEIAKTFAESSNIFIKILKHERSGISANYFNALFHSTGDIIVVGDQDDVWKPEKVATICRHFSNKENLSLVSSDSEIVNESLQSQGTTLRGGAKVSKQLERLTDEDDFLQAIIGMRLDAHTLAMSACVRDIMREIMHEQYFDNIENFWFENQVLYAAISIGHLSLISESLTLYRQHFKQTTGFKNKDFSYLTKRDCQQILTKLNVLRKLIIKNKNSSLFDDFEAQRRISLLDEFILFQEIRNGYQKGFGNYFDMTRCLLDGTYNRLTRKKFFSFVKDIFLSLQSAKY